MRLPRSILAWVAAWATLHVGATDVAIIFAPSASLSSGNTWSTEGTVRNRDATPSAALKWRLTAAESVQGALAGQHRFLGEGNLPPMQPGGVQNILASGTYEHLPTGTYQLILMVMEQAGAPGDGGFVVRDARAAGAATVSSGSPNYTGLWWLPGESGWGLNLAQQGSIIFATLFTYSSQGQPMWLVGSRVERRPDNTYRGKLYRTTGPAFNASPWGAVGVVEVGEIGLRFQGTSGFGIVTYDVDGVAVSKEMFRQVFASPVPTCSETTLAHELFGNYQALWWDPSEPGWGVNLTHQGDQLFATLFTYNSGGQAEWYVASDVRRQANGGFMGELYRMTGPAFNARPWGPVIATPVGTFVATFQNGDLATMSYSVNGVIVTKTIRRQVFSAPSAACQ